MVECINCMKQIEALDESSNPVISYKFLLCKNCRNSYSVMLKKRHDLFLVTHFLIQSQVDLQIYRY